MLFTITYTGKDPADLGYLLHKNPARPQTAEVSFGRIHLFYPETGPERCTAALLLDIDPLSPARNGGDAKSKGLFDYVNDRPYVCSSFMSTAIARVYGTAMSGRCVHRQELADTPLDLSAGLFMLPCRGGGASPEALFAPLGYEVGKEKTALDEQFPEWGNSPYINLTIRGKVRLRDLLNHIYVLIPVFDQQKHYWIGEDEVDKLLDHGKGWLKDHPQKVLIARRYFKNLQVLTHAALDRLEGALPVEEKSNAAALEGDEQAAEASPRLNMLRLEGVIRAIKQSGAQSVIDLGCGDGNLLRLLVKEAAFTRVTGVDVSSSVLIHARKKILTNQQPRPEGRGMLFSKGGCTQGFNTFLTALKGGVSNPFGTNQPSQQKEVSLFQGSLTYRDQRFRGYDAAALVEVIEHLDEDRLETLAAVVFGDARPGVVVISTPNREYNTVYGRRDFRHRDHRFEWTREEFRFWAERVAGQYGYKVSFEDIGPVDELQGPPTQMGVFVRGELSDGGGGPGPLPPGAGEEPADSFLPGVETLPAIEDVLKPHTVQTRLGQGGHLVPAPGEENSAAALEIMSRFSADPRWLIYLPPAMSPCKTSSLPEFLEHPREAFDYYRKAGLARIICEEKHPGSRAVIVLCRSRKTALDRFGVKDDSPGIIYTRKGRRFFDSANAVVEQAILERLGKALDRSGFWEACATDWVCLDTVLSPWPAKDRRRLKEQYAPVGRSGRNGLAAGAAALREALSARGQAAEPIPDGSSSPAADMPSRGPREPRDGTPADLNIAGVLERFEQRKKCLDQYTEVCRRYRRRMASPSSSSTASVEDYRIAPFHLLATEGKVWNNENHLRHLETIRRFMTGTDPLFIIPNYLTVDLNDENALSAATDWWLGLTEEGGEGMVVKPWDFIARRGAEPLQPAVKCRGREYLRIIYGPEYTLPDTLDRLRSRSLAKKRRLALAEFALGMESLERFVRKEPFHRLHECVFALLALKCEPMDPRL